MNFFSKPPDKQRSFEPPSGAKNWGPVTRSTRASAAGRLIKCPACGAEHRVYHFSWSALVHEL